MLSFIIPALQSKATVSLRQRQKRREAKHGTASVCTREVSRTGTLRLSLVRSGEDEEKSIEEANKREGVRKSQRIVKGKKHLIKLELLIGFFLGMCCLAHETCYSKAIIV